ncbi:hypothetical protein Tco_0595676 [Tanacetum coccineum]
MKELYDKVQESIKDSFKDFIPMDSEREKQMLKERDEKRLLRKRKATISKEQPSKKVKLRTETVDELINYLRITGFVSSVWCSRLFGALPPYRFWFVLRGWRLNDISGVHTLELEDGTMIHMLAERRYRYKLIKTIYVAEKNNLFDAKTKRSVYVHNKGLQFKILKQIVYKILLKDEAKSLKVVSAINGTRTD